MSAHRSHPSGQACWALLWGVVAFLMLQLGLGLALEQGLPQVRDPEFAAKLERLQARLRENPGCPLVLILGSSRVLMGVQAGRMHLSLQGRPALAFNGGLSGGGPLLNAICLRRLLAAGIRPAYLVLEVVPLTLNQPGQHALEEAWWNGMRLSGSEIDFLSRYHTTPQRLVWQWCKGRLLPSKRYQDGWCQLLHFDSFPVSANLHHDNGDMDEYGWHPYYPEGITPARKRWLTDFSGTQYATALGSFHLAEQPAQALRDLLAQCRDEHIPVALLLMPEGSAFRERYTPALEVGLNKFLADLSRQWQAPLINARTWLDDDAFWDSHHLLPQGAARFTACLQRDALQPLLDVARRTSSVTALSTRPTPTKWSGHAE